MSWLLDYLPQWLQPVQTTAKRFEVIGWGALAASAVGAVGYAGVYTFCDWILEDINKVEPILIISHPSVLFIQWN